MSEEDELEREAREEIVLMKLEKLEKETQQALNQLQEEIRELKEQRTIRGREIQERAEESAVERYMRMKEEEEELKETQIRDAIAILENRMTGTEYQMKWGELPPSWDDLKTEVPLEIFYETRLIRELGRETLNKLDPQDQVDIINTLGSQKEAIIQLGKGAWKELSDEERDEVIEAKMAQEFEEREEEEYGEMGFEQIKQAKEWEEEEAEMLREHLHNIYGDILPFKESTEDEYKDVIYNRPFKDWYKPDISDSELFEARINAYRDAIENTVGQIVRDNLREKVREIQDIYQEEIQDIRRIDDPDEKRIELDSLADELNAINREMRRIRRY
jgi:hypothetical protein